MARQDRRMIPRIWGVPPPPSAGDPSRGVLTVRNPDSPFWIGNLRNSEFRCLVPATAFMEWGSGVDVEGRRVQHWFAPSDQRLFAFAGVWKDSEVPTFAILTCQSNSLLHRRGRDTMPVILPADEVAHDLWLHGSWKDARELIVPYSSSLMRERQRG
jgi:putative SOS response-associated peptidase YedK